MGSGETRDLRRLLGAVMMREEARGILAMLPASASLV